MLLLAALLKHQAGQLTNYSNLARKIRVSVDTISRWIKVKDCFTVTSPIIVPAKTFLSQLV